MLNINTLIAAEITFCITVPPLSNYRGVTRLFDKGGSYTAKQATSAIKADWPWFIEKILKFKVYRGQLLAEVDRDSTIIYRRQGT